MTKKEDYKKGIELQKLTGYMMAFFGTILTLSIIFAIFGIPLIVMGVALIKCKEVGGFYGWLVKNRLK